MPKVMLSDVSNILYSPRAHASVSQGDAVPKEELVQLIKLWLITDSEQALVVPEVHQIVMAEPLVHVLVLILDVCLETVMLWHMSSELLLGY